MKILTTAIATVFFGSSALYAIGPSDAVAPPLEAAAPVAIPDVTNPQFFPAGALPPTLDSADLEAIAHLTFQELPPPAYDHKTTVPVWVIDVGDEKALRERCGWPPANGNGTLVGCARRGEGEWSILLGPESDMKRNGVTRNMVLRHETGHVNGWPADHGPGPAVTAAAEVPPPVAAEPVEAPPPPPPRRHAPSYGPPPVYYPPPPVTWPWGPCPISMFLSFGRVCI